MVDGRVRIGKGKTRGDGVLEGFTDEELIAFMENRKKHEHTLAMDESLEITVQLLKKGKPIGEQLLKISDPTDSESTLSFDSISEALDFALYKLL